MTRIRDGDAHLTCQVMGGKCNYKIIVKMR